MRAVHSTRKTPTYQLKQRYRPVNIVNEMLFCVCFSLHANGKCSWELMNWWREFLVLLLIFKCYCFSAQYIGWVLMPELLTHILMKATGACYEEAEEPIKHGEWNEITFIHWLTSSFDHHCNWLWSLNVEILQPICCDINLWFYHELHSSSPHGFAAWSYGSLIWIYCIPPHRRPPFFISLHGYVLNWSLDTLTFCVWFYPELHSSSPHGFAAWSYGNLIGILNSAASS